MFLAFILFNYQLLLQFSGFLQFLFLQQLKHAPKLDLLKEESQKIFINVNPFNFALIFQIGGLLNMDPAKSKRLCTNLESLPRDTCGKL